ncbi:MAG: hypothetical protein H7Z42_01580 [Roseiflexaceae bacterium]|nr:hypothetical protein [Roseiflexaceae bacterium]
MGELQSDADLREALGQVHKQMLELHRTLIAATRKDYEREHGPIENPYALLNLVSNHPAFAWLRPLTLLLVDIDDLQEQAELSSYAVSAVRAASAVLFMPTEDQDKSFYEQLRAARQNEPSLVTLHAHIRQALSQLPQG